MIIAANKIFFIWIGEALPSNIKFVINNFQALNNYAQCALIHILTDHINNLKIDTQNAIDKALLNSINILKTYDSQQVLSFKASNY